MDEAAWWPVALGVLGAVFGSFFATVAIRWPEGRSALHGRSACDGCGETLAWFELVPLASFLLQRGRCRRCGVAIAPIHVAIELLGVFVGVSAGMASPGPMGAAGALFGWLLLLLAALDLIAFWLPDLLTGALAVTGLAFGGWAWFAPGLVDRAIGGAVGFGILWSVAALYKRLRGRVGLGGGDPKLLGAIGMWMGWQALSFVLLIACFVGLGVVLAIRLGGRAVQGSDRLPFGVMLAIAAWAFALWVLPPSPDLAASVALSAASESLP
jgi:leader peptidase (prepilin peptidase) / N-methyltransferase